MHIHRENEVRRQDLRTPLTTVHQVGIDTTRVDLQCTRHDLLCESLVDRCSQAGVLFYHLAIVELYVNLVCGKRYPYRQPIWPDAWG